MFPFCTNTECTAMRGPHLWSDEVWTEVVAADDPHRRLPDGERGAVVYTHLWRTSQPMIRFAAGDAAIMTHEPCPCGRTYPRLEGGILGRLDDMLVVRGVNVYPSAIEHALREIAGVGLEFRIFVDRREAMDEISVQAELASGDVGADEREAIRQRAAEALRYHCQVRVACDLVAPGTFERVAGVRCERCGHVVAGERPRCPRCAGTVATAEFGPGGVVWASTVVRVAVPGREPPYGLAYVDLEGGPRILAHTPGDAALPVGSPVRLTGKNAHGDLTVTPG
jgi:uncharacterized OB-fold protein